MEERFGLIDIDGRKFQFNWARNSGGPMLILYDGDHKIEIPYAIWGKYPDSGEYISKNSSWHGKHKRGPEWASWGKRQAREMYRKYLKAQSEKIRL